MILESFLSLKLNLISNEEYAEIKYIITDVFEKVDFNDVDIQKIIDLLINETNITTYFIGKDFYANRVQNLNVKFFENFENFATFFKANQPKESLILIKGSRGMALEKTLELI